MYRNFIYLAYLSCLSCSLVVPSHVQVALPGSGQSKVVPALDQSCVYWETAASKDGKSFEIGESERKDAVAVMDKEPFDIEVTWPPGDETWKYLTQADAALTGITRYRLFAITDSDDYELEFTNTEEYEYFFQDLSGATHEVRTLWKGDQSIQYNSESPNIVYIYGE